MRIGIDGRVNYLFSMRPAVLISNLSVDKTKWPNGVPPSNWDSECVEFIRFVCFVKKAINQRGQQVAHLYHLHILINTRSTHRERRQ